MADKHWKERVGISINYSDNEDEKPVTNGDGNHYSSGELGSGDQDDLSPQSENGSMFHHSSSESSLDAILHKYELYGTTPPRTRTARHNRDWKRKEREERECRWAAGMKAVQNTFRGARKRSKEEFVLSNVPERPESDCEPPRCSDSDKRVCKRWMKLLRISERDYKLDVSQSEMYPQENSAENQNGFRADSVPVNVQPALKVEGSNRFLSLASTLVSCKELQQRCASKQNIRQELYNQLSPFFGLEKLPDSHVVRRQPSHEEYLWQNEVKDLIWLELQAWHANRTPTEQDNYLCEARERVEPLLNEIMEYRFTYDKECGHKAAEDESPSDAIRDMCLSMFCEDCTARQNEAIKEVEKLSQRLEQAEALYPSSKAFANNYPLYMSEPFVARVKAMWMWLNITKLLRLKLIILGRLFTSRSPYQSSNTWLPRRDDDSGHGSAGSADIETHNSDSKSGNRLTVNINPIDRRQTVRFDIPSSSPSDSAHSNSSSQGTDEVSDVTCSYYSSALSAISAHLSTTSSKGVPSPYKNFFEEVLKTKTLRKAVRFLDRLHRNTLFRACLTLEKPLEKGEEKDDENPATSSSTVVDGVCVWEGELRRHGFWSPEMQALNLPSYRATFLLLAKIPLWLIHAFLLLRLEQQPEHPSALSLRQLMREIKEGIRLAVVNRERYLELVRSAFWDIGKENITDLEGCVSELDESTQCIFRVYLSYLQKWCSIVGHESHQKNLLEEEWAFTMMVAPHIPNGFVMGGGQFCWIARCMLSSARKDMADYVDKLTENLREDDPDSSSKQRILTFCREVQYLFNDTRDRAVKSVTFVKLLKKDLEPVECDGKQSTVIPCILKLKTEALTLCQSIKMTIKNVEQVFDDQMSLEVDTRDNEAVLASIRETLHQAYRFGFEYHKEVCKTVTGDMKSKVAEGLIDLAKMWINFAIHRCERGRGMRPRWAYQGLDFLATVCSPVTTSCLSDKDFEDFKKMIEECIKHVVGTAPDIVDTSQSELNQSRVSSPTPRPRYRISRSHDSTSSKKSNGSAGSGGALDTSPQYLKSMPDFLPPMSRMERVRSSLELLDRRMDAKLRQENLIGCITAVHKEDRIHVRIRQVNFSWQRGIKIGQGSFGKVYTAVNNRTGELMAMKEIQLQHNDHRITRRVAEELRIFEGIQHEHLVRYYGAEIHRDEMLIFMEFCEEGTLETLVAATGFGLPEALIRRYTNQLLQAVYVLHTHGIVHRDIKSANIFLTNEGNCLKLGDFGSAVKIKAHTTAPGELQGLVGTQVYMAPEVFTRVNTEGHGRAVDIWSVGCVVIEMASGKKPWADLDSNYQVMFKVGMGESPAIPSSLSEEGYDFVEGCLKYDPRERATAADLLNHTFLKVDGDEPLISLVPSILEDSSKSHKTKL